jgi:hypothetical protein
MLQPAIRIFSRNVSNVQIQWELLLLVHLLWEPTNMPLLWEPILLIWCLLTSSLSKIL